MNLAEQGIATYLGEAQLAYLQNVTIGIAGVGGLGSNCAMHLVRCGFKHFVLVDYDTVEASNLNRQAYRLSQVGEPKVAALAENLLAVNPDISLDPHVVKITADMMLDIFGSCDVIIEAFDEPLLKKALVETLLPTGKLVVTASGIGGTGNTDAMVTRKVRDTLYMIGDMETECSSANPPYSPKVAIAAAKQADVVLCHYLEKFKTEGGA